MTHLSNRTSRYIYLVATQMIKTGSDKQKIRMLQNMAMRAKDNTDVQNALTVLVESGKFKITNDGVLYIPSTAA